jgi:hypothetical protein
MSKGNRIAKLGRLFFESSLNAMLNTHDRFKIMNLRCLHSEKKKGHPTCVLVSMLNF